MATRRERRDQARRYMAGRRVPHRGVDTRWHELCGAGLGRYRGSRQSVDRDLTTCRPRIQAARQLRLPLDGRRKA